MEETLPKTSATYDDAVRWIYDRIDYERVRPLRTSTHFRLERVESLLGLIGSPQKRIPAVHIAGTKGKGSTAVMVDAILTASGLRTGLFTSPHIHQFEERMRICGQMPAADELVSMVSELQGRLAVADSNMPADSPTYFEVATLLTWMYFDRHDVEIAVLETGLGGRLDCTNVCNPEVTVITAIGLDHTHILGDTIPGIAGEKAGILKPGIPVLEWAGPQEAVSVIANRAAELGCPYVAGGTDLHVTTQQNDIGQVMTITTPHHRHTDLFLPLLGEHQSRNAGLAVAAADQLATTDSRITAESVADGLSQVKWPLRFEIFPGHPEFILDAAHNPDSIAALLRTLGTTRGSRMTSAVLIFASSRDKDAAAMLQQLSKHFATIVLTEFQSNPRSIPLDDLQAMLRPAGVPRIVCASTPQDAIIRARELAGDDGLICGTGSIFLAAELRTLLLKP